MVKWSLSRPQNSSETQPGITRQSSLIENKTKLPESLMNEMQEGRMSPPVSSHLSSKFREVQKSISHLPVTA